MTQEEKAKAYDEALARLKPLYEQAKKDDNPIWSTYEYLIPELAESEDERMVKAIVHVLYENYTDAAVIEGVEIAEIVTWLEKQKEQKPNFDTRWENGSMVCEPKQEWSEEDENVYESIQTILLAEARFVEERKWFDSIKARIKSVCWDEKDEKMRDRLIDRLQFITLNTRTDTTSPNITFFDEIAWLKSLRPSWKPSEEQMEALNYAIAEWDGGKKLEGLYTLRNDLKKLM